MKKEKINFILEKILTEDIPPESINLWPVIKNDLVVRMQPHIKQGDNKVKKSSRINQRRGWLTSAAMLTLLLSVFLMATPQGRAFAQTILRFFSRSESNVAELPDLNASLVENDSQSYQPESPAADEAVSECSSSIFPGCGMAQVQEKVNFSLMTPADLPEGTRYTGASLLENGALMRYEGPDGIILLAQTQPDPLEISTWTIARDAVVETTTINNLPAEFIQGGWAGLGINEEGSLPWDAQLPTRTLRWKNNDTQFTLMNIPASTADCPQGLTMAQLTSLAEGLSSAADAPEQNTSLVGVSLDQAEKQAGFDFIIPSWLPPSFNLVATTYDSQHNSICQYYQYGTGSVNPALVIAQSNWSMPPINDLLIRAYYDGQEVDIPQPQTTIQLKGAASNTATLLENGAKTNAFCGGDLLIANRALVWQLQGRSMILFAQQDANDGRGFTTIKEMQRVAEALNGVDTNSDNGSTPDPERLLSKAEAEQVSTVEIRLPVKLLSNVRFDHISFKPGGENDGPIIATQYLANPVGDGRSYLMNIFQMPNSESTLEVLKLAGGFSPAAVSGKDALYQAQCWDSTALAGGIECHQILTWFDNSTQFEIFTHFPAEVPKEIMISIAESM